jgi:hypothetical protein
MNTVATIKITRPPEISAEDPCPVVLKDTFKMALKAEWLDGRPVDLTGAKIYLTIKAALADVDGSAKYQKNSSANPTIVTIDPIPVSGRYTISAPVGDLVAGGITQDTNYYIDTFVLTASAGAFTHLYDVIRPFKSVTLATT